jgi:hydrogenase maturation protease
MALLHLLAKYGAVIIADAVDMNLKPGAVRAFSSDDVISVKELSRLTPHEGDILKVLSLAKKLGQSPKITICAIQPNEIRPTENLSNEVKRKLPDFAARVASLASKTSPQRDHRAPQNRRACVT